MAIVKAVAFVSILVIVQVVGASLFIPSAQDTEKLAKQYVAATEGDSAGGSSHEDESTAENTPARTRSKSSWAL